MELPLKFVPKTLHGRLETRLTNVNWFRYIPGAECLEQRHQQALNCAISKLCDLIPKVSNPNPVTAHPSVGLNWISDFLNVTDDLKALNARVMGPMHVDRSRCNDVFQCLKSVILHPDSSDLAIESAYSMLDLLLPPPSQSGIACDTDWKPFYLLLKQSANADKSFRSGIDCPRSTSTAIADCIQSIAFYFSSDSCAEIQHEIRSAIRRGKFLEASALTTFLPPEPSCLREMLPDIFFLLDSTFGSAPSSASDCLDSRCLSAIAFAARCSVFPLRPSALHIDWSPYIDSIFSHAIRLSDVFNDGCLIHTTNPHFHDGADEMIRNLAFIIICLLFLHPSAVLAKLNHFLSRLEHIVHPLAGASSGFNAFVAVFTVVTLTDTFMLVSASLSPDRQLLSHSDLDVFVHTMLPMSLLLIPTMSQGGQWRASMLKTLYRLRPHIVAPKIAASIKSILLESIDCPDAFECVPVLLCEFDAHLFVPLHQLINVQLTDDKTDAFVCKIKEMHAISAKPSQPKLSRDEQQNAFALLDMLPELCEILLPRVDYTVDGVAEILTVFWNIFEFVPCLPLSQPLQLPPSLHLDEAVADIVSRVSSYFTRPTSFQKSFASRFFDQILSFCLQADQPDVRNSSSMGAKEDESRAADVVFSSCVEHFIVHLPLKNELHQNDAAIFTFDDALNAILHHCRTNSALHLPQYTLSVVRACMAAHSETTARLLVPFLMEQLLRPVVDATPMATPLPVRRNRVVGSRNERVLRYFVAILDVVLSGVNTNETRTFLLDFVPQIYDLDRFLLATKARVGDVSANDRKKRRSFDSSETASKTETHVHIVDSADREKFRASSFFATTSNAKKERKHQLKHLSSDGCDLVKSLLQCFCMPTLLSAFRLVPVPMWLSPEWRSVHFLSWGRGVHPAHAHVVFEIPTRTHLNCAAAIFRKFAVAPLYGLVGVANGTSKVEEENLSELKFMQRELALVTSCVRATRMFLAPFPPEGAPSRESDNTDHPMAFGPWFSNAETPASTDFDATESSSFNWDDVLSAGRVMTPSSTAFTNHPSSSLASDVALAFQNEYSADRPFAFGDQLHTLPGVSLQELILTLNTFSSLLQTASFKDGGGRYVDTSICNSVLELYTALLGYDWYERNCMWLMVGDRLGPMGLVKNMKPVEPAILSPDVECLNIFQRAGVSLGMRQLWKYHWNAAGWLPTLDMRCTQNMMEPTMLQILGLISQSYRHVDTTDTLQFSSISTLIMRNGPAALAQVAIALLDQLSDDCKPLDNVVSTIQLMRTVVPAYFNDWTLLEAFCQVLLGCRHRAGMRYDVDSLGSGDKTSFDKLWAELDSACFMRWHHSNIVPKITRDMLTSRTQALLNSKAATSSKRLQDVTLGIMAKEWHGMHIKYQMRCLRIILRFSSRDCPLSSAQWSYLWSLLPETVGLTADDSSSAKSCATYAILSRLLRASLVQLCMNFSGSSRVLTVNRPFELPFLDPSGQPTSILLEHAQDARLAVVNGFVQHLNDDSFTSRFALAASAAFDEDEHTYDDAAKVRTSEPARVSLFKLCCTVFGPVFLTRVVLPFVKAVSTKKLSSSKWFKLETDQFSNYMFASFDMLIGCIEAGLTLHDNARRCVMDASLPVLESFVLGAEVMQPGTRQYLCSSIQDLCVFCVGGSCTPAIDAVPMLQPICSMIFSTKGMSIDSEAGYLAKRIYFANSCIVELQGLCPSACSPFLKMAMALASHSSDSVRSAVSLLISTLRLCCSVSDATSTLLPWISELFLDFFQAFVSFSSDSLQRTVVMYMKSTLCHTTIACPSMSTFFPQLCRLLLEMFEDLNSSDSFVASLELQPGRLLCSVAEVCNMHENALHGILLVLRECIVHRSRPVRVAASSFCAVLATNMVMRLSVGQQVALLAIPCLLLHDANVEVRISAQTDLQRMMRSSALVDHIQQLARDFHAQAVTFPMKQPAPLRLPDHTTCIAGITGLAAIIGSRPFDVPFWLPAILDLIVPFVDYPPPMNKIAIKALDSFWVTHRSTWPSSSSMFDAKQVEILVDVFERIRNNTLCV